jgi:hypothetical protein
VAYDGRASTRKRVYEEEVDGVKLRFVLKPLGAYEADQITGKNVKVNVMTGETEFDMTKFAEYRFQILQKILVEAPFELAEENIKDIDSGLALRLLDAVDLGPKAIEARKNLLQQ